MNNKGKIRTFSVKLSESTASQFHEICKQNPDGNMNMVFADCVRFAYANGMYAVRYGISGAPAVVPQVEPPKHNGGHPPLGQRQKQAEPDVRTWLINMGAYVNDGDIVEYTKYEKIPTGRIVRNKRAHHIGEFPKDYNSIRKMILGSFMSLSEAEVAFEEQSEQQVSRGLNKEEGITL